MNVCFIQLLLVYFKIAGAYNLLSMSSSLTLTDTHRHTQAQIGAERQTERGACKGPNGLFLRFWNQMTVQKFKRPTRMDASGLWCTSDEDSWGAEGDSGEDFNVGATYTQRPRAGAQSARR